MEEFVKGEEKTYILQAESVKKENNQKPAKEDIEENIIEDTAVNIAEESNDTKMHDKIEQDISEQDATLQEAPKKDDDFHEPPKKIEVITGNANDLEISNVSDYLEVQKPKEENIKGNIIIPEEKKS